MSTQKERETIQIQPWKNENYKANEVKGVGIKLNFAGNLNINCLNKNSFCQIEAGEVKELKENYLGQEKVDGQFSINSNFINTNNCFVHNNYSQAFANKFTKNPQTLPYTCQEKQAELKKEGNNFNFYSTLNEKPPTSSEAKNSFINS